MGPGVAEGVHVRVELGLDDVHDGVPPLLEVLRLVLLALKVVLQVADGVVPPLEVRAGDPVLALGLRNVSLKEVGRPRRVLSEGVGHFIPGSPERAMRVAAVPFSMAVVLLADAAPVVDKPQVGDKPPRHPLTAPLGRGGSGGGLRLARTTMRAHDGGLRKGLQGRGEVEKEGKLRARRK